MMNIEYKCPNCQADTISKASVLYMQGTKTTGQSALAAGLTPPKEKGVGMGAALISVGAITLMFQAWAIALLLFAFGGFILYAATTYNNTEYKEVLQSWNDTYFCQRCGTIFKLQEKSK